MLRRHLLGRTGLVVSPLGFGALRLQNHSASQVAELLADLASAGINFLDTARSYEGSEQKLGSYLAVHPGQFVVASKSIRRDAQGMLADVHASLRALGKKTLDIYQLHNVKSSEELAAVFAPEGAMQALLGLKKQGVVSWLGITGDNFAVLFEAMNTGCFDVVQVPFNFVEQRAAQVIFPLARKLEMGLLGMKPLCGGQLKQSASALRFSLQQPGLVTLAGMHRLEHVAEARQVLMQPELSEQALCMLAAEAEQVGKGYCRRCGSCLPCPLGLNIPQLSVLDELLSRPGCEQQAVNRYGKLLVKADRCMGCGFCESRCPYGLMVRPWLKALAGKMQELKVKEMDVGR